VVLLVRDITARRLSDELRAMQIATTRILNATPNFEAGAPRILETVARALGLWGRGGVAAGPRSGRARPARRLVGPGGRDGRLPPGAMGPRAGARQRPARRVWAAVAPVIIPDLAADPGFRDAPAARA